MTMDATTKKWEDRCSKFLIGKTIKSVRYLNTSEMEDLGWTKKSLVLFIEDGYMYASSDDEGNNAGAYFCSFKGLQGIPTI